MAGGLITGWPCKAVLCSDERDERGTDTSNTEIPPSLSLMVCPLDTEAQFSFTHLQR